MKFLLAALLLFHGALHAQGLVSEAWEDAKSAAKPNNTTSSKKMIEEAESDRQYLKERISELEKEILQWPTPNDRATECADKRLATLQTLLALLDASFETIAQALKDGDKIGAALQYGRIKAIRGKAKRVFRDGEACLGIDQSEQPLGTYEESLLGTNTDISPISSDPGVNAPNKPLLLPTKGCGSCGSEGQDCTRHCSLCGPNPDKSDLLHLYVCPL